MKAARFVRYQGRPEQEVAAAETSSAVVAMEWAEQGYAVYERSGDGTSKRVLKWAEKNLNGRTTLELPLFTYGTLQTGGPLAHTIDAFVLRREPAKAIARLLEDAPFPYPGAIFEGAWPDSMLSEPPQVEGELVWFRPDRALAAWAKLDAVEGVHLDPPLYRRVRTLVVTPYDEFEAFAYEAGQAYISAWARARNVDPSVQEALDKQWERGDYA